MSLSRESIDAMKAMISTFEAAHRGSYCLHVAEWRAYRIRQQIPMVNTNYLVFDPRMRLT